MANVVLFAAILLAATAATHADKKKIVVPHRPGGPPSEYKRCILIDVRVNFPRLGLLLLLETPFSAKIQRWIVRVLDYPWFVQPCTMGIVSQANPNQPQRGSLQSSIDNTYLFIYESRYSTEKTIRAVVAAVGWVWLAVLGPACETSDEHILVRHLVQN